MLSSSGPQGTYRSRFRAEPRQFNFAFRPTRNDRSLRNRGTRQQTTRRLKAGLMGPVSDKAKARRLPR